MVKTPIIQSDGRFAPHWDYKAEIVRKRDKRRKAYERRVGELYEDRGILPVWILKCIHGTKPEDIHFPDGWWFASLAEKESTNISLVEESAAVVVLAAAAGGS